ncbi:DUF6920 family protein [Rhodococcus opacus]|uniref:DUF6920 family protein n=1 Tax=Rhodococcus opacus TaxID=37919 RepID=UPI00211E1C90|nr:DUF6544 family protein [Rhodococcus opacus]
MPESVPVPVPVPVPRAAHPAREQWKALAAVHGTGQRFTSALAGNLPPVARRWITHAVAEGSPMARSVQLHMTGQIRLRRWRPFSATQILVPGTGFIWAATTKIGGLPVHGYDRFSDNGGEMRWRLGGVIPMMSARGRDVTESAAGRLAGESISVPTSFPLARWSDGRDPTETTATWTVGGYEETVHLEVADDGTLRRLHMQRWGNPAGHGFGRHRFTVTIDSERIVAGMTIPAQLRAGWATEDTPDGEFFRAEITDAVFR